MAVCLQHHTILLFGYVVPHIRDAMQKETGVCKVFNNTTVHVSVISCSHCQRVDNNYIPSLHCQHFPMCKKSCLWRLGMPGFFPMCKKKLTVETGNPYMYLHFLRRTPQLFACLLFMYFKTLTLIFRQSGQLIRM